MSPFDELQEKLEYGGQDASLIIINNSQTDPRDY